MFVLLRSSEGVEGSQKWTENGISFGVLIDAHKNKPFSLVFRALCASFFVCVCVVSFCFGCFSNFSFVFFFIHLTLELE